MAIKPWAKDKLDALENARERVVQSYLRTGIIGEDLKRGKALDPKLKAQLKEVDRALGNLIALIDEARDREKFLRDDAARTIACSGCGDAMAANAPRCATCGAGNPKANAV